jgi:hypothetical protein
MVHVSQGEDLPAEKGISLGQVLLLVTYVFAGSMLMLTAGNALANLLS